MARIVAGLLVLAAAGAGSRAVAHPRVFLDPPTLARLRAAAKAGSPAGRALRARCEVYLTGRVEWPDRKDYGVGLALGFDGSTALSRAPSAHA